MTHFDPVFELIKSLSKSEKRSFKLYAGRMEGCADSNYIRLFDAMDRADSYNETDILSLSAIPQKQLANTKAHLYKQILLSIRSTSAKSNADIALREQIDFARILYSKGLYQQSIRVLGKAKEKAYELEQLTIALEIVEFEKLIESYFITRSSSNRADELTQQTYTLNTHIEQSNRFSNAAIQLYALYLKKGHVRNASDEEQLRQYFLQLCPHLDIQEESRLSFSELHYYNLSHYWYGFIGQDAAYCCIYARKNWDLFEASPHQKSLTPGAYYKSYNYLLESLFHLHNHADFRYYLQKLHQELQGDVVKSHHNGYIQSHLFYFTHALNLYFYEGLFEAGKEIIPEILNFIQDNSNRIDTHHIFVLYYKVASLYFGCGDYRLCVHYLNKIIHSTDSTIRVDLQCFSRILRLLSYFEQDDDEILQYQIRTTYNFLKKQNNLSTVQKEILSFLHHLHSFYRNQLQSEFSVLYQRLTSLQEDPYEKRNFFYIDILSWLESKIENQSVQTIIRNKFLSRHPL